MDNKNTFRFATLVATVGLGVGLLAGGCGDGGCGDAVGSSTIALRASLVGSPHCGQCAARSEKTFPHSGHLISDMTVVLIVCGGEDINFSQYT